MVAYRKYVHIGKTSTNVTVLFLYIYATNQHINLVTIMTPVTLAVTLKVCGPARSITPLKMLIFENNIGI